MILYMILYIHTYIFLDSLTYCFDLRARVTSLVCSCTEPLWALKRCCLLKRDYVSFFSEKNEYRWFYTDPYWYAFVGVSLWWLRNKANSSNLTTSVFHRKIWRPIETMFSQIEKWCDIPWNDIPWCSCYSLHPFIYLG